MKAGCKSLRPRPRHNETSCVGLPTLRSLWAANSEDDEEPLYPDEFTITAYSL